MVPTGRCCMVTAEGIAHKTHGVHRRSQQAPFTESRVPAVHWYGGTGSLQVRAEPDSVTGRFGRAACRSYLARIGG